MKGKIQKFLEGNNFLPLSNWNCFKLSHGKTPTPKDRRRIYSEIKKNVGEKDGLYVYEKDGKRLYIGKGNPMYNRIKSHYRESFEEVPGDTKYKTWHAFFSKHQGDVKVYWKELKDEKIRKIIEQMLNYVLKPKFESFRKEHESKEKKRKRKRL